jgi:VanZ family protein
VEVHGYSNLVRWLAVVLWAAAILLASSDLFSADHSGGVLAALLGRFLSPAVFATVHFALRKCVHLVAYGILGALAFRAWRGDRPGWKARWALYALAIVLVVASVDEWHQSTIPSRTGTPVDVGIDLMGAAIAIALSRLRHARIAAP